MITTSAQTVGRAVSLQPLPFDPPQLTGLSERLLRSHHQNNYGGAARRLVALHAQLDALDPAHTAGFSWNSLQREALSAANSVRLHELHFASLGGDGELPAGPLATLLAASFGSVLRWRAQFMALGRALAGDSGWVLLVWDAREARLLNCSLSDHTQALYNSTPILALDMYEHAYHMDFGADAAAWVETFMRNLHWGRVAEHLEAAVAAATVGLKTSLNQAAALATEPTAALQVIDVRRAPVFHAASQQLPAAQWRDPEQVDQWAGQLDRTNHHLVYCAQGHAISCAVTARLAAQGFKASFIEGGIAAWQDAGLPLAAR